VRRAGHAEEHGEAVRGRCCLALAVPVEHGEVHSLALGISMEEARHRAEGEELLATLHATAERVRRETASRAAAGEVGDELTLLGLERAYGAR
jgi:DNA-binding IclR family transcriptional regulator